MTATLRLCLGFIRTIRYWLLIKAVMIASHFSRPCADWIGERSGLNDALRAYLADSDSWEVSAEPSTALLAISATDI